MDFTERKAIGSNPQIDELTALSVLSSAISASLSFKDTADAAIKGIMDIVRPDLAFLFLREGDRLLVRKILPAAAEYPFEGFPEHRVGECLCGLSAQEKKPVYALDIQCDPRCTWDECKNAGIRSFAALPLRKGEDIFGVLGLASIKERDFNFQAVFLETLANQVSVALTNTKLYEAVQTELDERKKSEKRFRSLAESSPLGMHFYCLEEGDRLVFTGANPAADFLLGVDNSVFIGKTIEEAFPALIHTEVPQKYRKVLKTGETWETEQIEYDHEGIKGAFQVVAFMMDPGHMVAMFSDITGKKQAEETIRLNEARLEGLLRINEFSGKTTQDLLDFALNEVIVLTQSKTGYIFFYDEIKKELILNTWSRDVTQKCGVAGSQITYQLDKTGIWGEAVRQAKPIMINDYDAPNPLKKGLPDGHLPLYRFLTIPVFSEGSIVAVVGVANKEAAYNSSDVRQLTLMMDSVWKITQRRKAEEEKDELQARLLHAQKMEAIGALAGGIAHDFNNMMAVILGQVELTLPEVNPSDSIHGTLKEIEKAAQRSAELTKQLLAFARKQTVTPRVLDLNDTVSAMLSMLQRLIGEDIDLLWKPTGGIWPVMMDPSQLDQILANLCVNARDAISGIGRLTIETENTIFDDVYCAVHAGYLPGPYVMLAVSDNGMGMEKQTMDHIFEPFFTTKEAGKGTGLGLATVYGIVRQNYGFINVYSEPGKGTTFKIYLPRHGKKMEETPKKEISKPSEKGNETILIVEDETMILDIATIMLKRHGYTILSAVSPKEAVRLAKEHAGKIHLLMTDVVMPEMNGRELSETLLSLYPDLKCLFMSGYTANVIAHHGVLDAGVNFIEKPFSMNDLISSVQKALKSRA